MKHASPSYAKNAPAWNEEPRTNPALGRITRQVGTLASEDSSQNAQALASGCAKLAAVNPEPHPTQAPGVSLRFVAGTVEIAGLPAQTAELPGCAWDERSDCLRAPACRYADVVRALRSMKISYHDEARRYDILATHALVHREPRPYQIGALTAWKAAGFRGVVVLPTGAGKTLVAHLAMIDRQRSTLVVTPTLDLVRQWHDGLRATFGTKIGIVGGGDYDVQPLTVTTYDSAYLHMEHLGCRFGLVVFDECHHLPGESYALGARFCLAPFRLGLTATPERTDGRDPILDELVGPIVYRKDIVELAGEYLADYETVRVSVDLSDEERAEYDSERAGGFEPLRYFPKGDKQLVLGLVTSKSGRLEAKDDIKRYFDRKFWAAAATGADSESPIFVLGMPRTGTTLIDRILCSHSQVGSVGECDEFFRALVRGAHGEGEEVAQAGQVFAELQEDVRHARIIRPEQQGEEAV